MKQPVIIIGGLGLMLAGAVGGIWHKYFTTAGSRRFTDSQGYISEHWCFWVAFLVGVALVWAGVRKGVG
jgi:hypothetical protein